MSRKSLPALVIGLAAWLGVSFLAGAVGAMANAGASGFYAQLQQPSWAPPGWLFGPVWSLLFVMMGVAAWLVWRAHGWRGAGLALGIYLLQLVVNALWSWLFFAWHLGGPALADIGVLWLLVAATIALFWRLHRVAALLLLPYLAWASFAGALNAALWRMNPSLLG